MDEAVKRYALVTIAIAVIVIVIRMLTTETWLDWFLMAINMLCIYPIVAFGAYCFLEGKGYRSVNGIDFSSLTENQKHSVMQSVGLYMMIGGVVMMVAMGCLMVNVILLLVMIFIGTVIMIIPFLRIESIKGKQFVERTRNSKIMIFAVVSLVAIVPTYILMDGQYSMDSIEVQFEDDRIVVNAPMSGFDIEYEDITYVGYDPEFDKGVRLVGYGTPTIKSGQYQNAQFGGYTLASYTKVKPCVYIEVGERYYAFNQSDEEKTEAAYQELLSRVSP